MTSVTEICNRALVALGQEPILTLDDSTKSSRMCVMHYESTRDTLLRSYPWSFAIVRASLAEEQAKPAFGFTRQFKLPQDCLRLVSINVQDGDYEIENARVLTDEPLVEIRYVSRVNDPNIMDPMFIQVLVYDLAVQLCYPITGSDSLMKTMYQRSDLALTQARHANAIETSTPKVIEGNWIPVRY